MKVLLIEPRSCWIGLSIALAYISGSLKQAGDEVKVLDLTNHRQWSFEVMGKQIIQRFKPDLIGISLYYINYYPLKELVSSIKKFYECPIVVGGPQMMIEKEQILNDIPELDYGIIGDGESAIVELCKAIRGEISFSEIDSLIYRRDGKIVRNKDREVLSNIDDIPFPDYGSFGVEKIRRYSIMTSRGCPYRCSYCFRSTPKWRPRSPENVIEELKHAIKNYKIEEFVIVDDAFNIRPERMEKFCHLLDSNNINLPWSCTGVRADRITESLVKWMKKVGCYRINIGVETLQPELYELLNRHMSIQDIVNCIQLLRKYNLNSIGYFMIGLPGETQKKTWDTYKKAKKIGIDYPHFSLLLPFPGTKMYDIVYNLPGVKRLEDYKNVSTIWTNDPQFSRMKVAFETPEYTGCEKIEMYNKLRTKEGDPRPPYHKSLIIFGVHALIWILKYDLSHSPITIYKLFKNFLNRFIKAKGKHVFMIDNIYEQSFMKDMEAMFDEE